MILGNHDSEKLLKKYPTLGFEGVFASPVRLQDDYLSHEPLSEGGDKTDLQFTSILKEFNKNNLGATNYHGHIHSSDFVVSTSHKNVCCEALQYKPLLIGKTAQILDNHEDSLFINSPHFTETLTAIKDKNNIDPGLLINDYIYSYILSFCNPYQAQFFVQGSFSLLKKYSFLSSLSDIDFTYLYDTKKSKGMNTTLFKTLIDDIYENLKKIDFINLRFIKRYSSLRIIEALYTSQHPYFSKNYLDANLIPFDCYCASDFLQIQGTCLIEKFLNRNSSLLDEYSFPNFQTSFLKPEGDLINLLLQLMFQQVDSYKRSLIIKKIQLVYKQLSSKDINLEFINMFTRFFLRNIAFFHTMNRYSEIKSIQKEIDYHFLDSLPLDLKKQIQDILLSSNSNFLDIYKEVSSVSPSEALQTSLKFIQKLK